MQETPPAAEPREGIEMPRPTSAPIMMAVGAMCMAAGLVLNWMFSAVVVILFFSALGRWVYILATGTGRNRNAAIHAAYRCHDSRPRYLVIQNVAA